MNIIYHYQNYLKMDLGEQFDLITLIYCDYGELLTKDREIIMKKAYEHLKPGGRFLFDVFTMAAFEKREEQQSWSICPGNGFWREEECAEVNGSYPCENHITLNMTSIITQDEVTPYYIWDTCFSRETLTREAVDAGFRVCDIYGDAASTPYCDECDTTAVI